MPIDTILVFVILGVTILLFLSDRLRLDLVALLSLLALTLTGILTPAEAIAGFADPVVLIIAGLFVVSGGLFQTGVADRMGLWLGRVAGESETRLLVLVMLMTGALSGFMSSTGTVAVMLPVVASLARRAHLSPSKLLIPLAFASLLGGMLTLIGTPPNIVASNQLADQGLQPFGFFAFTPIGLVMLLLGLGFMLTIGRRMLPARAPAAPRGAADHAAPSLMDLAAAYELPACLYRLRVNAGSPLIDRSLRETDLRRRFEVTVLGIVPAAGDPRRAPRSRSVAPDTCFQRGDLLLVHGEPDDVQRMGESEGLALLPERPDPAELPENLGMAEVLLPPHSRLIDRTLRELRFRDHYRVTAVALKRGNTPTRSLLADTPLRFGDTLLVKGPWRRIHQLREERRDLVVITEPPDVEAAGRARRHAPVAVAIMLLMMGLMTFELVPTVTAVLLAAVLMVLLGCLTMEDAYRSMNWESVVLIAGILPMATALDRTGGMQLIVDGMLASLGDLGPTAMMAGLFVLTSLFSQVISNTATTVLVAPVAFQIAATADVSPYPFLMTVALAASTAFATPIASPVNTLVLGPGAYRFTDFARVGLPLQLLVLVATLLLVPLLFPLRG